MSQTQALEHGGRAVGLRHRADPGRHRPDRGRAGVRIPPLSLPENAGIKRWVNGAFTFSPDGNPLVGPVRGVDELLGRLRRHGGIPAGRRRRQSLAEWMIQGEPEADMFGMDIARYGDFASNREYHPPDDRTVLLAPLRPELSQRAASGRATADAWPARTTRWRPPARAGATPGAWKFPIYFAPKGFSERLDAEALQRLRSSSARKAAKCAKASASSISRPSRATKSPAPTRKAGSTGCWRAAFPRPAAPSSRRCSERTASSRAI